MKDAVGFIVDAEPFLSRRLLRLAVGGFMVLALVKAGGSVPLAVDLAGEAVTAWAVDTAQSLSAAMTANIQGAIDG